MSYLNERYDFLPYDFVKSYDDAPVWSVFPGQLVLEQVPMDEGLTYLDLGCGTGFPLVILAERLGPQCQIYGVDIWESALQLAKEKLKNRRIDHANLLLCDGAHIELPDNSLDVVTSNLGINNFEQPERVIRECHRILRPGGTLVLSTNVVGSFKEFYDQFADLLREQSKTTELDELERHVQHRSTMTKIKKQFDIKIGNWLGWWKKVIR